MEQLTYFAQTANYNCAGASDSSYGAGAFGTCTSESTTTTGTVQPGAPNTGEFLGLVTAGSFSIILPLIVAIVVVSAASFAVIRKKRTTQR